MQNIDIVKADLIAQINKRLEDKIIELTNAELLKKLISNAESNVNAQNVEKIICERRPGDIAECYANPEKALKELNWKTELTIEDMCKSAWEYAKNNL